MDANKVWLNVVGQAPAFDPDRYEYRWNRDYTAYRVIKLRWHDDASYAAYQASDLDD